MTVRKKTSEEAGSEIARTSKTAGPPDVLTKSPFVRSRGTSDGQDRLRSHSLRAKGKCHVTSLRPQKDQHCPRDALLSSFLYFSPLSLSPSSLLRFFASPRSQFPFPSPHSPHNRTSQHRNRENSDLYEMERRGKPPRYDQPSFSSTLLDAIYRSIDESDGTCTETEKCATKQSDRYSYKLDSLKSTGKVNHHRSSVRTKPEQPSRHRSSGWAHSTSSSSECSSYGGFSSSEAESVRLKPIRTAPRPNLVEHHFPVQSPAIYLTENKKKSSSIKSRIKEFRKTKQQLPASPGARLASFLNAIFPKKGTASTKGGAAAPEVGSTCSTASSYARSCLSKTPSTAKRSVRFCPVSVVVGEEGGGDRRREAEGKKRVEEILRGLERDEEEEEEDSDSSSDLFELEDLTVGIERRFRDELPVYGTTSLGMNNKGVPPGLYRPVI